VLAMVFAPAVGQAYFKRYMPLTDEELARRVSQHRIPIRMEAGASARFEGGLIRLEEDGTLLITGRDLQGRPWQFTGHWSGLGGEFYSADLDHNGKPDLIYAWYTGGNGLAPPMHVTTLMFDEDGRPVPSEMDGYFEFDKRGIEDLVDLDGDGRAELIRQAWDDGYWITSVYEASGARWHRIEGEHAGRRFPLYTRFTHRSNRVATTPAPGRHPVEGDLSNDSPLRNSHLLAVRWANVAQSENPRLVLDDQTVCEPVAWYSSMTVILDSASGRTAATLKEPESARELLETIRDRRLPVQIMGKRRYAVTGDRVSKPTGCVPETVWASTGAK
jgi:hypothetical protein